MGSEPENSKEPQRVDGATALIRSLEMEGVEVIFGYPGGAILPVYDPIIDSPVRHILARHEQGAGHMAEGYAHVTGRPGVCIVTSGPAATNIVTPLADAYMDSIPMICITGQVGLGSIGTDAFQEVDTTGITRSVTKHNFLVTRADEIPRIMKEAFHLATTGRPGPVLIDVPKDISDPNNPDAYFDWYWPDDVDLPGYCPELTPSVESIEAAVELMVAAERPVLYVGGGVLKARAAESLLRLANLAEFPVVTTLMARGAFPDSHIQNLGMPGMHGNYTATTAIQRCDLLISVGARFDDRITGAVDSFAPTAKVIHIDIDPAEHGKVRHPEVPILGDARIAIDMLVEGLEAAGVPESMADRSAWRQQVSGWQEKYPVTYQRSAPGELLKPQYVLEQICELSPDDTIVASGVGQHQMFTSQYWKFDHPYTFVNSGGLGTMGFSIPAAIGAKVGKPDRTVWAIDGDGCFQMTAQELVTATIDQVPVKIALINNANLGMVRQWQTMFYHERLSETHLGRDVPDYIGWAESMGCAAFKVEDPDEVAAIIEKANAINDRPVVVEFRCVDDENVFPMVIAGGSNDDVMVDPSQQESLARDRAAEQGEKA